MISVVYYFSCNYYKISRFISEGNFHIYNKIYHPYHLNLVSNLTIYADNSINKVRRIRLNIEDKQVKAKK
jgi:hypothetical protein